MAEFTSQFKYRYDKINYDRKELLEKGPDSAELPSAYYGTLVGYYWEQKNVSGMITSILHPLIREEIVSIPNEFNVD